jgi:hypothetical protein
MMPYTLLPNSTTLPPIPGDTKNPVFILAVIFRSDSMTVSSVADNERTAGKRIDSIFGAKESLGPPTDIGDRVLRQLRGRTIRRVLMNLLQQAVRINRADTAAKVKAVREVVPFNDIDPKGHTGNSSPKAFPDVDLGLRSPSLILRIKGRERDEHQ